MSTKYTSWQSVHNAIDRITIAVKGTTPFPNLDEFSDPKNDVTEFLDFLKKLNIVFAVGWISYKFWTMWDF